MDKISTAYALAIQMQNDSYRPDEEPWLFAASVAKAFAKLHVEVALKEAKEIVAQDRLSWEGLSFNCENKILNAYPLENIK